MRGFSLPVVLFTVSLGGALAVGGAFVARQAASTTRVYSRSATVDGAAQEWAVQAIVAWDSAAGLGQAVGSTRALPVSGASGMVVEAWVTRASGSVYWVVVEAVSASKPLIRRRLGVIVTPSEDGAVLVPSRAWGDLP